MIPVAVATVIIPGVTVITGSVVRAAIDHAWRHHNGRCAHGRWAAHDWRRATDDLLGHVHRLGSWSVNDSRMRFEYRQRNRQRQRESKRNVDPRFRRWAGRQPHPDYC
jgi:hypothetical protein